MGSASTSGTLIHAGFRLKRADAAWAPQYTGRKTTSLREPSRVNEAQTILSHDPRRRHLLLLSIHSALEPLHAAQPAVIVAGLAPEVFFDFGVREDQEALFGQSVDHAFRASLG